MLSYHLGGQGIFHQFNYLALSSKTSLCLLLIIGNCAIWFSMMEQAPALGWLGLSLLGSILLHSPGVEPTATC